VPLGEFWPCAIHNLANICVIRYCFGGAIAGRLGSTDFVNTIVIAHPSNLKPSQIRAIKVNLPRIVCPSHDFTYVSP
jgi:Dienelactone hydrolase family